MSSLQAVGAEMTRYLLISINTQLPSRAQKWLKKNAQFSIEHDYCSVHKLITPFDFLAVSSLSLSFSFQAAAAPQIF